MWLFKYAVCLVRKHLFIPVQSHGSSYQYCLRCGKLAVAAAGAEDAVAHDELASV